MFKEHRLLLLCWSLKMNETQFLIFWMKKCKQEIITSGLETLFSLEYLIRILIFHKAIQEMIVF